MGIVAIELPSIIKEAAKSIAKASTQESLYSFNLIIGEVSSIKQELMEAIKTELTNNGLSDIKIETTILFLASITEDFVSSLPVLPNNRIGIIIIPDYMPNAIHYHQLINLMFNPAKQKKTGWNLIAISKYGDILEWQKDSAYDYFCEEKGMGAFQIL